MEASLGNSVIPVLIYLYIVCFTCTLTHYIFAEMYTLACAYCSQVQTPEIVSLKHRIIFELQSHGSAASNTKRNNAQRQY